MIRPPQESETRVDHPRSERREVQVTISFPALTDIFARLGAGLGRTSQGTLIIVALLALSVGFDLYALWPQVAISVPQLNDGVLHLLVLGRVAAAMVMGQDVTDPWIGSAPGLGYPFLHYYQHLPYLLPGLLRLLASAISGGGSHL